MFGYEYHAFNERHTKPPYFSLPKAIACVAIGAAIVGHSAQAQTPASTPLTFDRCSVNAQAVEVDAECATLIRHENPKDKNSRTIELSVVRFPSHSPEPESDAFTLIQGGPGGSSIDLAVAYSQVFDGIRRKRDVIVIDQRGTGRSNLLSCELPDDTSLQFDIEISKTLTKECADKLSLTNDLRYFTSSIAVDDLEALRITAGYSQLNLYGVSYGTRVVQHYLRKYPNSARSAVIDGVVQPGLNLAGGEVARRWEDSFEAINKRCQERDTCRNTHGDLRVAFEELQAKFTAAPVSIKFPHPSSGQIVDYTFNQYSLFTAMRLMAYGTETSALMPLLLSEARRGNYIFAASQILQMEALLTEQFSTGMHNSVVCTEDAPFVTKEDQARAAGTIASQFMSEALLAACSVWPRGVMDEGFLTPFSSEVPVLVLSGETDPITPPRNGDASAKMLGNTKHIIVPAHGHGVLARGCVPNLVGIFLESASFEEVDDTCIKRENAMPIFTTLTGPRP